MAGRNRRSNAAIRDDMYALLDEMVAHSSRSQETTTGKPWWSWCDLLGWETDTPYRFNRTIAEIRHSTEHDEFVTCFTVKGKGRTHFYGIENRIGQKKRYVANRQRRVRTEVNHVLIYVDKIIAKHGTEPSFEVVKSGLEQIVAHLSVNILVSDMGG